MNVNKVFIVGRMTADPQLRTTPSGQPVTSFSVATNRVWTNKAGSKQEETEFHNVVAWGRTAEIASQFLKKGSLVFVEGRLRTRAWQDKQGQNRRTTEIMCERLQLGPRPAGGGGTAPNAPKNKEEQASTAEAEIPTIDIEEDIKPEDLPF